MFGRQPAPQSDHNDQLDDEHAAYVTDLTTGDGLAQDAAILDAAAITPPPSVTKSSGSPFAAITTKPVTTPSAAAPVLPPAKPNFDVTSVVASAPALPASDITTTPATPTSAAASTAPAAPHQDVLLDIKHQALTELSPLVGHLNQTPEESFRTTMMLIQASDDPSLLAQAHEAAKKIQDDTARAKALLDIVNEINYFTQSKQ